MAQKVEFSTSHFPPVEGWGMQTRWSKSAERRVLPLTVVDAKRGRRLKSFHPGAFVKLWLQSLAPAVLSDAASLNFFVVFAPLDHSENPEGIFVMMFDQSPVLATILRTEIRHQLNDSSEAFLKYEAALSNSGWLLSGPHSNRPQ